MKMISIDEIIIDNKYLRITDDVDTLIKSIETVGLIHPLVINKSNHLLAGGRRYSALKELGREKVPVVVVDRNPLEQELISIEENIIRQKLNPVEFESVLRRAKDIYEELYPELSEDLDNPLEDDQIEVLIEETGRRPFVMEISEKTGITPSAVRSAIKRDIESSSKVKKARSTGDINGSQATQISKLDKGTQNEILSVVVQQSLDTTDTRKLVKDTIDNGFESALISLKNANPAQKDYKKFLKTFKKLGKEVQAFLETGLDFDGSEKDKAIKEAQYLHTVLTELLEKNK